MSRLEQLITGASVRSLVGGAAAKVGQVEWFGGQPSGRPGRAARNRQLYRTGEPFLKVQAGRAWSFVSVGSVQPYRQMELELGIGPR